MTFEQFVAEIETLAQKRGATQVGKPYCEAEAWRDAFNDGMTPAEAWAEEMSNASEQRR